MPDAAHSRPKGQPPRVVVYKKERCPLCDEAITVIAKAARSTDITLDVIDLTEDPALLAEFGHEVPVVFIDGRKRFFGRVDPVMLRRALC